MKILSIDLPWLKADGNYGFAWVDLSERPGCVTAEARKGSAASSSQVFASFAENWGVFDVVLLDQPIGGDGAEAKGYRRVERAFGNSSFFVDEAIRIQAPRFQPGSAHVKRGRKNAKLAQDKLGSATVVVIESFPQLSILPLVDHGLQNQISMKDVKRLAAHKHGGKAAFAAAGQLITAFRSWTGLDVDFKAAEGQPDAVDALLALLPALEVLAPRNCTPTRACWLHHKPPGNPPLPREVSPSKRLSVRAAWMSSLVPGQIGRPGIREDGILSLVQPGWRNAAVKEREL